MPKYKLKPDACIMHDGKLSVSGDIITCTEEQAALLSVEEITATEEKYADMTVKELITALTEKGVEIPAKATKAILIDLLTKE